MQNFAHCSNTYRIYAKQRVSMICTEIPRLLCTWNMKYKETRMEITRCEWQESGLIVVMGMETPGFGMNGYRAN